MKFNIKTGKLVLQLLVFVVTSSYIIFTVWNKPHFNEQFVASLLQAFSLEHFYWMILCIFLMPVNWGLEALKWQKLSKQTFYEACLAVVSSLSLRFVVGQTAGDILGRVWHTPNMKKRISASLTLYGHLTMGFMTGCFGWFGLMIFLYHFAFLRGLGWYAGLSFGFFMVFCALCFIFYGKWVTDKLPKNKVTTYLSDIFQAFTKQEHLYIFLLSFLRYAVFTLQFILVFYIFEVGLPFYALLNTTVLIFLGKTLLPSLSFLSDLGVREFTAVYFLSFYDIPESTIISATLTLWLLNILLPAFFGVLTLLLGRKNLKK